MRWEILVAVVLLAGCRKEPPVELRLGEAGQGRLVVDLVDFGLRLERPDGTVVTRTAGPGFAFGSVDLRDDAHFYDPLFDDEVRYSAGWTVLSHTVNGDTVRLDLNDGVRDATLDLKTLEAGAFEFVLATAEDLDIVHTRLSFEPAPDERYWGLGEWFDASEHHGRVRNLRFELLASNEAGHNQRHVRTANYLTNTGYGVHLLDPEPLTADFRSVDDVSLTQVRRGLTGRLFVAEDPLDLLAQMHRLSGLAPVWPKWAFAPQQWRNAVPVTCTVACSAGCSASETGSDIVLDDATRMRDLDLPASVIWIDAPWESGFNTYEFNPVQFPDPKALIDELHALGYRVIVWTSPFVNKADDSSTMCGMLGANAGGLWQEAAASGFLVSTPAGRPIELPWRGTSGSLIDFTNPAAVDWWKGQIRKAVDLGVDGFKLDFDQYVVPALAEISLAGSIVFFDGSTVDQQQTLYSAGFHRAHYEAVVEGGGEPFLIGRTGNGRDSAWTTAIWPGDLCSGFQIHGQQDSPGDKEHAGGLPASVHATLSLATSLHPHYGSDIGGFRHGQPSKEVLGRWIEHGALSTIMQLGGGGEHHNPWDLTVYDQELLDLYARYARLHIGLFPYLYTYVNRNSAEGTPIVRPVGLQYPADLAAADAPYQYLFGEDLLVAPIVEDGARAREVVFPEGSRWVHWWTDTVYEPGARLVPAPFDELPLFAREGAIVPMLDPSVETLAPATDPSVVPADAREDRRVVRVYPADGEVFRVYDGTTYSSTVQGEEVVFEVSGAPRTRTYEVRMAWALVSNASPGEVRLTGGTLTLHADRATYDAATAGAFYDASTGVLHARFTTAGDRLTVR